MEDTQDSLTELLSTIDDTWEKVGSLSENRTFYDVFGADYLPIGKEYFLNELETLKHNISSFDYKDTDEFRQKIEHLDNALTLWGNASSNLFNRNVNDRLVNNFLFLLRNINETLYQHRKDISLQELQLKYSELSRSLMALEKRLNSANQKLPDLDERIEKILTATKTADSLPETLETLSATEQAVTKYYESSMAGEAEIAQIKKEVQKARDTISETEKKISDLNRRSELALASATSAGLASAFKSRAEHLEKKGDNWRWFLVISLVVATGIGIWRVYSIFALLGTSGITTQMIAINTLLSVLIIAAPLWMAWLSTKQINYLFKLSEDYAFKATTSTAYEGFRREASSHGEVMEGKVLESTLERFGEPPLRFVDASVFGSPLQELAEDPEFRKALKDRTFFKKLKELFTRYKRDQKTADTKASEEKADTQQDNGLEDGD